MIATNGLLKSLPVETFSIQNLKSKIQNGISSRDELLKQIATIGMR
ncbi:hypothetical protein H6G74_06895 [Nostoc spongiaeforme FACHB-130]|uniref:Uncharacterized protein n=1 Tax=Nostoc spongiaeforme FACHB-130 TaxID=1357510 RepID=A0ABR8FTB5_9NOSO|nr:hypothetical protein [Nostoc spongiaeforme]MBD2594056.1 hypothetical protein [Nostoc spongiaeforme FACHB-130]